MTTTDNMPNKVHEGRNIKRFREMLGIKQETLAQELGEDWTQSKVSHLETKETVDSPILEQVARVLKVNNHDNATGNSLFMYYPTFNPIDKIMQLYDEKIQLYERMLKEKNEVLEKLLAKKK
jgi:transcriptional regulator with XRE-family HTH domain